MNRCEFLVGFGAGVVEFRSISLLALADGLRPQALLGRREPAHISASVFPAPIIALAWRVPDL
jgi:hypothetical protein